MLATIVFLLCAATSTLCAVLLLRAWSSTRSRLLLWSALCFTALAVNNILLIVDWRFVTSIDLSMFRTASALIGVYLLVFGLVWEAR